MENKLLIKEEAIKLRKLGYTFSEINFKLSSKIPKGTLSYWLKDIRLPKSAIKILNDKKLINNKKARDCALKSKKIKRNNYLNSLNQEYLSTIDVSDINEKFIALAMLYLGEGSKTEKGSLTFGNSNPDVISSFMYLLRKCFGIKEDKFRCIVQCRYDQDSHELEKFWSKLTKIPKKQFYKTRKDPRTIGKPSKKLDYKGVCRVEYLCADTFHRIMAIIKILTRAFSSAG